MPWSGSSALHGVNPNKKKKELLIFYKFESQVTCSLYYSIHFSTSALVESLEQSSLNHNSLDLLSQNFLTYQEKFKRSLDLFYILVVTIRPASVLRSHLKGINAITKFFFIFCNQKKYFHQRCNKMVSQQEIHGSI